METSPSSLPDVLSLETFSHPFAVRELLSDLIAELTDWGVHSSDLISIELVAAEALNNVYEHACLYKDGVFFGVTARLDGSLLRMDILDRGAPMPGLSLPKQAQEDAKAPDVDVPLGVMPEGGWGWMLIRDLTETMEYQRENDQNALRLSMRLAQQGA